jgi:hypothetical protein
MIVGIGPLLIELQMIIEQRPLAFGKQDQNAE